MSRNGSGTYTLPAGNPVVTGTTIESTWANTTLSDIATTLTDSLSRSGQGGMTAALRLADGTQGAPGLGFANETGSGFYRAGTGEVWAVVQGAQTLNLDATGVYVPADKTTTVDGAFVFNEAGADKDARFEGDTDANLLFTDASTDRVGIGTNTPSTKLHVVGDVTVSGTVNATTLDLTNLEVTNIKAKDGTSAAAITDGTGVVNFAADVGVGAGTPAFGSGSGLEIQRAGIATLRLENSSASNSFELYADSAANGINLRGRDSSRMNFWTANTSQMTLDASGNLGIGTGSPVAKLEVVGSVGNVQFDGNGARLTFTRDDANYIRYGSTNGVLVFEQGSTERARIDSSGNLGIGATAPSQKLHVNGTTSTYIRVSSTNASTGSGIFTSNATNTYLIGAGASSGGSGLEFRDETNAATRMVLTSGGNFGIGTTTVNARLHVSGNVAYTIPVSFAGASGNTTWATGFLSQAVNASILATDSIIGANIYSVSDKRLKENITPLPDMAGLEFVRAVDPVSFDWKSDKSHDTGFIAQSLLFKGYGHLVSAIPDSAMEEATHDDGNVSPAGTRFVVRYDSIVPILHAAIRDQQALIETLMARVAALEAQ